MCGLMVVTLYIAALCHCKVYYVKPSTSNPADLVCPGDPCHTLNYYIKLVHQPLALINGTITMILMEGYHKVLEESTVNFGSPLESELLHFKGSGPTENVIVEGLETIFYADITTVENITAIKVHLLTSLSSRVQIFIWNCTFIDSKIILSDVDLVVKDSTFSNCSSTAIVLYSSEVTFGGQIRFIRNTGHQGGALALIGTIMQLVRYVNLLFKENQATDTGGAIFVANSEIAIGAHGYSSPCFYNLIDYDEESTYNYSLLFVNNSANNGGDHIYGASLISDCDATFSDSEALYSYKIFHIVFHFDPGYESALSAVSADASSVCICDTTGQPQCHEGIVDHEAYPGSPFTIPVTLVGGDYGTTTGTAYIGFTAASTSQHLSLGTSSQSHLVITVPKCNDLTIPVYSNKSSGLMYIAAKKASLRSVDDYLNDLIHDTNGDEDDKVTGSSKQYYDSTETEYTFIDTEIRFAPLFINITFLPCPPGFILIGDPPGCCCHPMFSLNGINCILRDMCSLHTWNSTIWVDAADSGRVSLSTHCPFGYCKHGRKYIDLKNYPDAQCAFNHAGRLCGRCKENYSLAIGSSHCIYCPNNNNLALLIFFAAAGIILVFIIAALNLTVTQGAINGLIFYTNTVWAYKNLLFPPEFENKLIAHKVFIAWLNLDFGIETCFIKGMNAYLRTWLQFVFPFYTASLFLIGVRYSSKLSKLLGSRSVPTLATLLFLSYSKLLRTIIACLRLVTYYSSTNESHSKTFVWALDGNLSYGCYPHIFLLLGAIICTVVLWMPYTLFLFSMQWLRRVDHYGPLKFLAKYKPVYDAYFAPLNDKHQYWFGVLLLVQGILFIFFALDSSITPSLNILLLLGICIVLLCYLNNVKAYKKVSVLLLESSFLVNLIVVAAGTLYFGNNESRRNILLSVSVSTAFVEFCGIVAWNLIPISKCCQIVISKCLHKVPFTKFPHMRKYTSSSTDHTVLENLQIRITEEHHDSYEGHQYYAHLNESK